MGFGRKGLDQSAAGQTARHAGGFGAASAHMPDSDDPYAEQRQAFLAEERSRRGALAPASPRDFARPEGAPEPVAFTSNYAVERSDFKSQVAEWTDKVFGQPRLRSAFIAYLLLLILAPLSMHRFYCGEYTKGMAQVALFVGGLMFTAVFPPLGLALLFFRGFWVFFDFLMIPGMMLRHKDRSGNGPSVMV